MIPLPEICLDLVRAATAMVDQVVSETREFHQPPESIATELMRHIPFLSWENDVLKQDLITWQDAKDKRHQADPRLWCEGVQEGHRRAGGDGVG